MKYRVRLDMCFEKESDARLLVNYAKAKAGKTVNINEGRTGEEISFCDLELCGHDEGQSCTRLKRHEFRKCKEQ
jgi:hypothetical protein